MQKGDKSMQKPVYKAISIILCFLFVFSYCILPTKVVADAYTVTGTVRDSEGNLAQDFEIRFKNIMSSSSTSFHFNEQNGTYSYSTYSLDDGEYSVTAIPLSGPDAASLPISVKVENYRIIEIEGEPCTGEPVLNFQFEKAVISGYLRTPDGDIVTNGRIGLYKVFGTHSYEYLYGMSVKPDGSFAIAGLENDMRYALIGDSFESSDYSESDLIEFYVDSNGVPEISEVDVYLNWIQCRVMVKDLQGNYMHDCGHMEVLAVDGFWGGSTSGWKGGNIMYVSGMPDGIYYATVALDPEYQSATSANPKVKVIEIVDKRIVSVDGEPVSGIPTLIYTVSAPEIIVEVKDDQGEPITEAYVNLIRLLENGRITVANTRVNNDGEAYFSNLLPNTDYCFEVEPYQNTEYVKTLSDTFTTDSNGEYTGTNPLVITLSRPILEGKLSGPDGEVITDGYVNIYGNDHSFYMGIQADSEGLFKLPRLDDGYYQIDATYSGTGYMPVRNFEIEVRTVDGKKMLFNRATGIAYTDLEGENPFILRYGRVVLTGQLFDPLGRPVFNSFINIRKKVSGGSQSIPGIIVIRGIFSIGEMEAGEYILTAEAPIESNYSNSNELHITVTESGSILDSDGIPYSEGNPLIMRLNYPQLQGFVRNPDGTAASYGYIEISKVISENEKEWLPAISYDNKGKFNLAGLTAGEYLLKAFPGSQSNYTYSQEVSITVEEQEEGIIIRKTDDGSIIDTNDPLILVLSLPTLTGKITGPSGESAPYGWVQIQEYETYNWVGGVSANSSGVFKLGRLNDGMYILTAFPNYNGTYTPSNEVVIEVSGNGTIVSVLSSGYDLFNFVIKLNSPQIRGTVYGPVGSPHENVHQAYGWISVTDGEYNWYPGAGVDSTGSFAISGLENGSYYLVANPNGYNPNGYTASVRIEVQIDGGGTQTINIHLTRPQIVGKVTNPDGSGARWANVEVYDPISDRWITSVSSNENGDFFIGALADGSYRIKAWPDASSLYNSSQDLNITIADGQYINDQGNNSLELQLTEPMLIGEVINSDGITSAQYGWVEIKKIVSEYSYEYINGVSIGSDGKFKLPQLEDGIYTLKAIPDTASDNAASDEVTIVVSTEGSEKKVTDESGTIEYNDTNKLTLLYNAVKIRGIIMLPGGQTRSQFGYIQLFRNAGDYMEWVDGVGASEKGEFKLGLLAAGEYVIRAYPNNNNQFTPSVEYTLLINEEGECVSINGVSNDPGAPIILALTLPQIQGVIKAPEGISALYSYIEIQKIEESDLFWIYGVSANENGEYSIGGLLEGSYRLRAYPDSESALLTPSDYIEFEIDSNGEATNLSLEDGKLVIMLKAPQVTGTLKTSEGTADSYGWIEVLDETGQYITGVCTNSQGKYVISGLNPGSYKLIGHPGPWTECTSSDPVDIMLDGSGTVVQQDITLNAVSMRGRVYDPFGYSTSRGWVEIRKNDGTMSFGIGLNSDGSFYLHTLETGEYTIQAIAYPGSGFANSKAASLVIGEEDFSVDGTTVDAITLNLTTPKETGTVTNIQGKGKNCWIEIGDEAENWLLSIPVAPNGTFTFPELVAGNYIVQAFQIVNGTRLGSDKKHLLVDGDGNYTVDAEFTFN